MKMKIKKIFKRFSCKHDRTTHIGTFLESCGEGKYVTRHIWKCKDCGKEIWGR